MYVKCTIDNDKYMYMLAVS